jgi:hypothetical protein
MPHLAERRLMPFLVNTVQMFLMCRRVVLTLEDSVPRVLEDRT